MKKIMCNARIHENESFFCCFFSLKTFVHFFLKKIEIRKKKDVVVLLKKNNQKTGFGIILKNLVLPIFKKFPLTE